MALERQFSAALGALFAGAHMEKGHMENDIGCSLPCNPKMCYP